PRQRQVAPGVEESGARSTQRQRAVSHVELDPAVGARCQQLRAEGGELVRVLSDSRLDLVEQRAAEGEVHGPAIVRVDERQVPQLGPLVEVGNAGRRDLEQQLAQRVDRAVEGHEALKWPEGGGKWTARAQEPGHEFPK